MGALITVWRGDGFAWLWVDTQVVINVLMTVNSGHMYKSYIKISFFLY